jgi:hypothetical protein
LPQQQRAFTDGFLDSANGRLLEMDIFCRSYRRLLQADFLPQLQRTYTGGFLASAPENFYKWISCLSYRGLLQVDFLPQLQKTSTSGFLASATEDFYRWICCRSYRGLLQMDFLPQLQRTFGSFTKILGFQIFCKNVSNVHANLEFSFKKYVFSKY